MRILAALATVSVMATGCDGLYTPPNIFKMARNDVYSKVARADVGDIPKGLMHSARVSRSPTSSIKWTRGGIKCTAKFIPVEETQTQVDMSCAGGSASDGAAAGMVLAMARKEMIEFVDAAIRDRPYDVQLAKGATASGWPADIVKHDNIFEAQSKALAMEADLKRQIAESR